MLKRILFINLLFILLCLTCSVAFAQERSVVVQRRDADMTINIDGSVNVVETWVVDFRGGPFRAAFRAIPFNRISSLVFDGVSENRKAYTRAGSETPNTYSVDVEPGERILNWYFTPATNETRTFELRYRLFDALRIYEGGDQFWWKFIEADRGYPIQNARVTLQLPSNFNTDDLLAATYTNRNETNGAQILNGQTIEFTGGPFGPNTEWEIRAQFPHGVVTQSVQTWQAADDARVAREQAQAVIVEQFSFYSLAASLLLALGGGLGLLLLYFVRGRDRAVALPAEFLNAPPEDPPGSGNVLTPALAGTLIDEEANVRDVLATLIDWAQRGIIKIRAMPQGAQTPDPNDDYVYEKIGTDAPPLQFQYERELMQRLWQGDTSRNIGYIRQKFTASLQEMFDGLYDELVRRGYFQTRPDRVRAQFYRYGWLLLVLLCPGAFLFQLYVGIMFADDLSFSWQALLPWVVLFIVAGALMLLARSMPRKTDKGALAAARWNAFKRYLERIEKYTNVADAQDQFEKYLPYAVAFGIDKTWVEKFAKVNTPAPTWYTPPPTRGTRTSTSSSRSSTSTTPARPFSGGVLGETAPSSSAPGLPSLNDAASGSFNTLNNVSSSFFSMLNTTATSFVASNPSLRPSSGSSRSGSSGRSSWSGGSSRSSSSSSRGGGGGGGGRSGFR